MPPEMRTRMPSTSGARSSSTRGALEHRVRLGLAGLGQQQRELVAADAGEQVLAAQQGVQARAERRQHAVAGGVAGEVVDRLEVVDVDQRERQRALVPGGAGDLGVEALLEGAVVGEAGQRVGERAALEQPASAEDHAADDREDRRGEERARRAQRASPSSYASGRACTPASAAIAAAAARGPRNPAA